MALKLLKTHEANNKTAKVYRDSDYNEHRVKFYRHGRYQMGADYHTDDVNDAHGTAKHFINKIDEEQLQEFLVQTYANGTKNKVAHVHKDLNNGTFTVSKLHNNKDVGAVQFDHSHHAHEYAKKFINEGAMEDAIKQIENMRNNNKKRDDDPEYKEFKERKKARKASDDEVMRRVREKMKNYDPSKGSSNFKKITEEKKFAKEEVDYSEGMGKTRCKNCVHYEGNHSCELVEGTINPEYWCKKFKMGSLSEDGAMAAGPTNNVGSGAIAGLGVGKQGEPGVDNRKRKRPPIMMALLKRKAPK